MAKACFICGGKGEGMYGFAVCDSCRPKLKLLSDKTIRRHYLKNPEKFSREIRRRLDYLEKDHIMKKIKLLHVQERLKRL